MAKKKKQMPADPEVIEAKTDAIAEEVAELAERVDNIERRSGSATFKAEASGSAARPGVLPEFDYGGDRYRFRVPKFRIKTGAPIAAADAVNDEALLDRIVTEYPGVIEKIG